MDMETDENSTIKNIVREIYRDCMSMQTKIEEPFILYCVQLLKLDPNWGISEKRLNRINVQKFVHNWVLKMRDQKLASTITLKIQDLFLENITIYDKIVIEHREELVTKLKPLRLDIFEDSSDFNFPDEKEQFLKKIIYYITLLSGLGNPTNPDVFKEAQAALLSVFFDSDIDELFATATKTAKTERLHALSKLVVGIRLYNKECGKGGHGIEDLFSLIEQGHTAMGSDLQRLLVYVMQRVNALTTAVENCYVTKQSYFELGFYYMAMELPEGVTTEELTNVKELLLLYRQYEWYQRKILTELIGVERRAQGIKARFQELVAEISTTIHNRTAIPAFQIYPLFTELADIWHNLQDEAIILVCFNQVLISLQSMVLEAMWPEELIAILLGLDGPVTDAERQEKTSDLCIKYIVRQGEVILPERYEHKEKFEQLELQYLGFCPWKLVEMQGALIPGHRNMGILKYNDMNYAFSSMEAAEAFSADPKMFIMQILTLAREKPEFINFINVLGDLIKVKEVESLFVKPTPVVITHEVECQTMTHIVEEKVDPEYSWNIWEWKRRAIKLANLAKCKTKAVQTVKSRNRNAFRTQTHFWRDKHLQTHKDNYTNVPTLSNYIFGLRGRKDDRQFVIELTRPIEET